jgi:hypothetical protein
MTQQTIITLQPSEYVDHITEDGAELTRLPYPFHCTDDGRIKRQDIWRGKPARMVGFVSDLNRQEVDLYWESFRAGDPEAVVGLYMVTQNSDNTIGAQVHAVKSVTVSGGPRLTPLDGSHRTQSL